MGESESLSALGGKNVKYFEKIFIAVSLVLFLAPISFLPASNAVQTSAQIQSMTFIENVLPVDLSKYQITFVRESTFKLPDGGSQDTVLYDLVSQESTFRVAFNIQNGAISFCQVMEKEGLRTPDKQYSNLGEAAKSFLGKYQTYSKLDSTKLEAMLEGVDTNKNSTVTKEDIKLTVTNGIWGNPETHFKWALLIDGFEYYSVQLALQRNGAFDNFLDTRLLYTVGDTSIRILKEQAIDIALKNLPTYSYKMPDKSTVSDFNVNKDGISANIVISHEDSVLRPYWDIRMPLTKTYPGSVQGITAFIWANTGEIIEYSNIAYGGIDNTDSSQSGNLQTDTTTSHNSDSPNNNLVFGVALLAIVIAVTLIAVVAVKRKKK
jgi:hypothetical protein